MAILKSVCSKWEIYVTMILFKLFKNYFRQGRSCSSDSNPEYSHILVFGFEALSTKSLNSLYVAVFFMAFTELFKLNEASRNE